MDGSVDRYNGRSVVDRWNGGSVDQWIARVVDLW